MFWVFYRQIDGLMQPSNLRPLSFRGSHVWCDKIWARQFTLGWSSSPVPGGGGCEFWSLARRKSWGATEVASWWLCSKCWEPLNARIWWTIYTEAYNWQLPWGRVLSVSSGSTIAVGICQQQLPKRRSSSRSKTFLRGQRLELHRLRLATSILPEQDHSLLGTSSAFVLSLQSRSYGAANC